MVEEETKETKAKDPYEIGFDIKKYFTAEILDCK